MTSKFSANSGECDLECISSRNSSARVAQLLTDDLVDHVFDEISSSKIIGSSKSNWKSDIAYELDIDSIVDTESLLAIGPADFCDRRTLPYLDVLSMRHDDW